MFGQQTGRAGWDGEMIRPVVMLSGWEFGKAKNIQEEGSAVDEEIYYYCRQGVL
jgi:hypothetical protein